MKKLFLIAPTLLFFTCAASQQARAQSESRPFELGVHYTAFRFNSPADRTAIRNLPVGGGLDLHDFKSGLGARFAYNVTRLLALEAEANYFPEAPDVRTSYDGGLMSEALFGVRVGKRTKRFGVFGKARPGFVYFNQAFKNRDLTDVFSNSFRPQFGGITHFAFDLGGVVEYYPSPRTILRFDVGDTIIRYGSQSFTTVGDFKFTQRDFARHNLQLGAGFGFRF